MTEINSNGELVQLNGVCVPPTRNHTHPLPNHTSPPSTRDEDATTNEEPLQFEELIAEERCGTATGSGDLDLSGGMPPLNELITEQQHTAATDDVNEADSSPSSGSRRMVRSRPDLSEVPPLNELITEQQYKALSEMAEKIKLTLDPQLGNSVCLGKLGKL